MRWFKHDTNMRNDHFIQNLITEHGLKGYAVYVLLLEIFAGECGNDPSKELSFNVKVLAKNCHVSVAKLTQLCHYFDESVKVLCRFENKKCHIQIPKMAQLKDNYSRNLQVTVNNVSPNKKQEEETRIKKQDEDIEIRKSSKKVATRFEEFWDSYPKKKSKVEALKIWQRKTLDSKADEIINAVIAHSKSQDWIKEAGKFIPYPTTFLNQERWDDEITDYQAGQYALKPAVSYKQTGVVNFD